MTITYPPEMLPEADGQADVFVQRDDGKFVKLTEKLQMSNLTVSPHIQAAAASQRTEQQVRDERASRPLTMVDVIRMGIEKAPRPPSLFPGHSVEEMRANEQRLKDFITAERKRFEASCRYVMAHTESTEIDRDLGNMLSAITDNIPGDLYWQEIIERIGT